MFVCTYVIESMLPAGLLGTFNMDFAASYFMQWTSIVSIPTLYFMQTSIVCSCVMSHRLIEYSVVCCVQPISCLLV